MNIKEFKKYRKSTGFIVHPFETGNNKYHASYGNHNKTVKSFNTLREAKSYLQRKGIEKADYDSPSGAKLVKTKSQIHRKKSTVRRSNNPFGSFHGIKMGW
jgi:hypothetical protein